MVCLILLHRCGEILFIPCIVSRKAYDKLSMHERGTMVEAYIGALYEQCHYRVSQEFSVMLEAMISLLRQFVSVEGKKDDIDDSSEHSTSTSQQSQFNQQQHLKKAKTVLLEIMQKRGVTHAGECVSIISFYIYICMCVCICPCACDICDTVRG